jgi:hypothetical protein
MRPFVIWAATRTSSTSLASVTGAENEPFHFGPPANRLNWAYEEWQKDRTSEKLDSGLSIALSDRPCFKHLPEWFDDEFNVALAIKSTEFGYRHIHLIRLNELDRLISTDVAGQLDSWWPKEARERFAELRKGERKFNPLDVPRLIENAKRVRQAWWAVERHLSPVLHIVFERLTGKDVDIRVSTLRKIAAFLDLPPDSLRDLDLSMQSGGQNTAQILDLLPNVGELRTRLMEEGLV